MEVPVGEAFWGQQHFCCAQSTVQDPSLTQQNKQEGDGESGVRHAWEAEEMDSIASLFLYHVACSSLLKL